MSKTLGCVYASGKYGSTPLEEALQLLRSEFLRNSQIQLKRLTKQNIENELESKYGEKKISIKIYFSSASRIDSLIRRKVNQISIYKDNSF